MRAGNKMETEMASEHKRKNVDNDENDVTHGETKKQRVCGIQEKGSGRLVQDDVGDNLGNGRRSQGAAATNCGNGRRSQGAAANNCGNGRGSQGAAAPNFGNTGTSQGGTTYNSGYFAERSVAIQLRSIGNTEAAVSRDAADQEVNAYMYM